MTAAADDASGWHMLEEYDRPPRSPVPAPHFAPTAHAPMMRDELDALRRHVMDAAERHAEQQRALVAFADQLARVAGELAHARRSIETLSARIESQLDALRVMDTCTRYHRLRSGQAFPFQPARTADGANQPL